MRDARRLYAMLEAGPTPDCDEILGAGLALAEPEYFDELVGILLRRRNDAAWGALIEHWPRLTLDVQAILRSEDSAMMGGVARAMRGSPDARYHALLALEQAPRVGTAYLLPAGLRDDSARVRDAAARCFRRVAELHFDHVCLHGVNASADQRGLPTEHDRMLAAVREVLATFDVHLRADLIESCLWFASELGDGLWETLSRPRTRLARVVATHLREWNSPRLAAFLLLALRHSEWRTPAQLILRDWEGPEFAAPLLRQTHLLSDPETAGGVAVMRCPAWLRAANNGLPNLPPALRPCAPAWIVRLGMPESERLALLAACARRGDVDTQTAAIDELVAMARPAAAATARELLQDGGTVAILVQQALDKRKSRLPPPPAPPSGWARGDVTCTTDAPITTPVADSGGMVPLPTAPTAPAPDPTPVDDFLQVWQQCRRSQEPERQALVERLRLGADAWQPLLAAQARSDDVRDRMQLLRVLESTALAPRFADLIDALTRDPVAVVRDMALRVQEAGAARRSPRTRVEPGVPT
ncbi:MAG: hypothetical protein HRU75_09595 [Planctomycetia bacterium]|nr:MAG: hypothetical protein HRU75_09595 [Planctomycetia bacterium]